MVQINLFMKQNRLTKTGNKLMVTKMGKMWRRYQCSIITPKEKYLKSVCVYMGMCVCVLVCVKTESLCYFTIYLKLAEHCKSTML